MPDLKPGDNTMRRDQTMFEKKLLAHKRILVTGGGSGLGAAMGRRFAELGAELIICGRRTELLEQTAARLRNDVGAKVTTITCDIRDGAAVDAMMDTILAPTLHGAMYCTLAAGRRWIEGSHKGVILSILSTSTITGRAFTVPSAMAKTAV